jgi:hypothetical protein
VAWVAHKDCGSDLLLCSGRNGDGSIAKPFIGVTSAAICVVHNLATLGVADQNKNGVRTLGVERIDLARDGSDTLNR